MARSAAHDEGFAAFVADARPGLGRVAYLMCGNWHSAEDAVQAVLERMYGRWERVAAQGDAYAYARRAVVNAVVDERRRPWRRERSVADPPDAAGVGCGPGGPGPEGREGAALDALARIPARQRAVVVLRYLEGLSVAEVAAELGVSEGTVKSQAARGLDAVRVQLPARSHTAEGRAGRGDRA